MANDKPVLTYFEGRGRGEYIRMMLAAAGVDWTEKHLKEPEDIEKLRKDGILLFQQVPLVQWNGVNMVQSSSIARYIARKYNLYGKPSDEYRVDMLTDGGRDFFAPFLRFGFEDPKTVIDALKQQYLPRYMTVFEKILESSSSGFLVGDGMTMADISVFEVFLLLAENCPDGFNGFPKCKEFFEKMKKHPKMAAFLNSTKRQRPNDEKYISDVRKILKF